MSTPTDESVANPVIPHSDSQALREQLDMLAALGKSLHQVGLSAHRVEDALRRAAAQYGTPLQVFSLPTGLMLSVDARPTPVTMLLRVPPGAVHLEQLSKLSAISARIIRGSFGADGGPRPDRTSHASAAAVGPLRDRSGVRA